MRKFLFLLVFIFSVSTASNVLATGAWQSCSGTGPIGSAASVCQDLVKQAGESYVYSHMDVIDDSTASCYAKYKNADGTFGSGSPDMVGSACKIDAGIPGEGEGGAQSGNVASGSTGDQEEVPKSAEARTKLIEGKNFFREVEIVNAKGSPIGEFDEIDLANQIFVENKTAKGLDRVNPRTGLPAQSIQSFVDKQIVQKTSTRIENLLKQAVSTRPTPNGTQNVPAIEEIRNIKHFMFKLAGDTPQLRSSVSNGLAKLQTNYPGYIFEAIYGGKK